MTKQEIFNTIWTNEVILKKPRSIVTDEVGMERCKYRGENGAACYVGQIMPDRIYHESLEGESADVVFRTLSEWENDPERVAWGKEMSFHDDFMCDLQECHDDIRNAAARKTKLIKIAETWNLTIPG